MKIGFFLGYGPQVILAKEGLGRYVGSLIKGVIDEGHQIVIACPLWQKESIKTLLKEYNICDKNIAYVMNDSNPPIWRFYEKFFFKSRKSNKWINLLLDFINLVAYRYVSNLIMTFNLFEFTVKSLIGILSLILIIPVCIFVCLVILISNNIINKLIKKLKKDYIKTRIQKILKWNGNEYSKNEVLLNGFNLMLSHVLCTLIEKINKNVNTDVWYIPSLFWPETKKLKGIRVYCAPDLVPREYAVEFRKVLNTEYSTSNCIDCIKNGIYFITYCDFIKDNLLVDQFAKKRNNIISIAHANNDMKPYIYFDDTKLRETCNSSKDFYSEYSKLISELGDVKYIFYSSQIRPYKNVLNLIKAFEYLLRSQKINHKLVLTGYIPGDLKISSYIKEHNLKNEVICCYNISAKRLAAVYKSADLVVNPTLYEGGFPFTFGEGMSVGTPSIMSDIPQVRDVLEPAGLEEIMFDPYDWHAIADKIEWALSDLEVLYQKELPLYHEMEKRTYSVVAAEYVDAFKKFIELDEHNKDTI